MIQEKRQEGVESNMCDSKNLRSHDDVSAAFKEPAHMDVMCSLPANVLSWFSRILCSRCFKNGWSESTYASSISQKSFGYDLVYARPSRVRNVYGSSRDGRSSCRSRGENLRSLL